MPKEEQEKKKPGIVRRIFKWIGLGLLTVLIILGLVFQAPWKVITLLLIVLAACRILPKPAVKWFWLSVGVIIIALIIWVFLPDGGDWQPYKYNLDKELAALEAKRAIPDSENAATIYNQLLEDYDKETLYSGLSEKEEHKIPMHEPWLSKDHPEIAKWLEQHQMTIQTLMEAVKIEKCRFAINNPIKTSQHMDNLSATRRWAYLLVTAASNDVAENRTEQGLEKYTAMLQMAKHLYQQATIIDFLVGAAVEALAVRQFDRFVVTSDATEKHLSIIEKALAGIKHDWSSDFSRIFEYEKLLARSMLSNFYEENLEGKTRLSQDPLVEARANAKVLVEDEEMKKMLTDEQLRFISKLSLPLTYRQRKVLKASTILSWFFMPPTPQKAGEIIDDAYARYYAMAEPDFDWQKGHRKFSPKFRLNFRYTAEFAAGLLEESYHRVHDIYLRLLTDRRGCELLIGLRRHKNKNGVWPESLDEIKTFVSAETFTDPINGGEFVYKLTEENFTLYSRGKNNVDDGGERDEEAGTDDWLIWPPRTGGCETEEENTDDEQQ